MKEEEKKTRHSFSFGTPSYSASFKSNIEIERFNLISQKAIEQLGWELLYEEYGLIEGKASGDYANHFPAVFRITFEDEQITILSKSAKGSIWDLGRNSKRVNAFFETFQKIRSEVTDEEIESIKDAKQAEEAVEDFDFSKPLPPPTSKEPQIAIPLIGGLLFSVLIGYTLAFITYHAIYIIGLFELGVGFLLGITLGFLLRKSNFTHFQHLNFILIGITILAYVFNQYFLFQNICAESGCLDRGFVSFIQLRLENGLVLEDIDTGWIGLVLSWAFQVWFTYLIAKHLMTRAVLSHSLDRIPQEVIDFSVFHFLKYQDSDELKSALEEKGWKEERHQEEAHEAVNAVFIANQMRRPEID